VLLFGHTGIALGIVKTYENLTQRFCSSEDEVKIDYRYVLIGAMLPDFIDKPLVMILSSVPVHSARSIAHSITFALFLLVLSVIFLKSFKSTKFLVLTVCCYIHLALDKIWLYPKVFLWPLHLLKSKNQSITTVSKGVIDKIENAYISVKEINWFSVYAKPEIYISEVIGLIFIVYYFIKLMKKSKLKTFLVKGEL
jgi:hypothetical protein